MTPNKTSQTILLAISTTRESPKTIDRAMKEAKSGGGELVVLFVVDHGIPDSIGHLLITTGYLGEKPSRRLADAILDEYRERGQNRLATIFETAIGQAIECETMLREGDFAEQTLAVIQEKGVEKVIVTRAKRSGLSRFLFGSGVNRLRKESPCPVEIVGEK
jgi:nucleotide-binding universal stress UspA family protein